VNDGAGAESQILPALFRLFIAAIAASHNEWRDLMQL